MPSRSLHVWEEKRLIELEPIEAAHAAIVGVGSGRRYVTQQINQAFAVLLSSQFQGFCRDASNQDRKAKLEELNSWRNAIAHQDFSKPELRGKATISLSTVKSWRVACRGLAISMDEIMRRRLTALFGLSPW